MSSNDQSDPTDPITPEEMASILARVISDTWVAVADPSEAETVPTADDGANDPTDALIHVEADQTVPSIVKPKKKRCAHQECRKRITLTDFACKCGNTYCPKHRVGLTTEKMAMRNGRSHFCTFDYKAENQKRLRAQIDREGEFNYNSFDHGSGGGGNAAY